MLQIQISMHIMKNRLLKIMHHSLAAFQKLIIRLLIIQKILQCLCKICLNTVKIIQKQQEVCGITTEMNQIKVQ